MKPIEETVATLALGFAIGVMAVIAADKLLEKNTPIPDSEVTRADELISIYKRGMKDALRTNPVSFELEQTCLEVWANKQPVDAK
jgi:UDP-N-acetylmuramyl pentapeptide phosphotransferase/UDP-N-acetylglucosamine-1-phosphate transferase